MFLLFTLFFSCLLTTTPHEVAADDVFVTGSKAFEITDYSIVSRIPSGDYIELDNFTVGGYQWVTKFYPQGVNSSYSDFITLFLQMVSVASDVRAMRTHRLWDCYRSTWSADTPASSTVRTFHVWNQWGYLRFIRKTDLETSNYLKNDKLVIKTTVWVVKSSSSSLVSPLSDVTDHAVTDDDEELSDISTADVSFGNNKNQANA